MLFATTSQSIYYKLPYRSINKSSRLIKIIKQEYPDLVINTAHFYDEGHSNKIFEINNTLLFRFSKKNNAQQLAQSVVLLKYLRNKITAVQIPNIIYEGKNYLYIGYEKIAGGLFSSLSDLSSDEQALCAVDIARFLAEIHSSTIAEYAQSIKVNIRVFLSCATKIANLLRDKKYAPDIVYLAEYIASEYNKVLSTNNNNCYIGLIHGDLHGGNILVDPSTKKIKGVFDFDLMHISNIHEDFIWFYKKSFKTPFFFVTLVDTYEKLSDKKLDVRTIALCTLLRELQRVTHFNETTDNTYKEEVYENITLLRNVLNI